MNLIKESYIQQIKKECNDTQTTANLLIALPFALIGYGVGEVLTTAFTDNMWWNILVPIAFSIAFALVTILTFKYAMDRKWENRKEK